ncbi:MAG: DUF4363 family protein [Clostridiales bacterium]|nr:DUF4363 family protein [Clostridiales bacterium]
MKKLVWAVIVLIIFVASSFAIEAKLKQSVDSMLLKIQELTNNLKNENWNYVDTSFEEMVNIWEEKGKVWSVIIDHNEIDQLTIALYKSKTFANYREKEEALAELKQFEFMVDHIPKIHKLELKNIL